MKLSEGQSVQSESLLYTLRIEFSELLNSGSDPHLFFSLLDDYVSEKIRAASAPPEPNPAGVECWVMEDKEMKITIVTKGELPEKEIEQMKASGKWSNYIFKKATLIIEE